MDRRPQHPVVDAPVRQLELERLLGGVARFAQQSARLGLTLFEGLIGPAHLGALRRVVGDARRHEAIGRGLPRPPRLVDDEIAVDRHVDRLPDPDVAELRVLGVEHQIGVGQPDVGVDVVRNLRRLAQVDDAVGFDPRAHVDLAAANATLGGDIVLGREVVDLVEADVLGGVVPWVLHRPDAVAQGPGLEDERAVADHVARPNPGLAQLAHHMLGHRVGGGVGQQAEQIGRRMGEPDLHGHRVQSPHPQGLRPGLALVDGRRVLDHVQQIGVFGRGLRVLDPPHGEDEVVRRDRLAIGPQGARAQLEGPDQAVRRGGPGDRRPRHGLAGRVLGDQPFEQVAQDVGFPGAGRLGRVEGARLGAVADEHAQLAGRTGRAAAAFLATGAQQDQGGDRRQQGTDHLSGPSGRWRRASRRR